MIAFVFVPFVVPIQQLTRSLLFLAAKQSATVPLMNGHRIVGVSLLLTGDILEGRESLDRAITFYDPVEHPTLAARFAVDIAVCNEPKRT